MACIVCITTYYQHGLCNNMAYVTQHEHCTR